jgi:diadenosine tetraphosphatase ApaH/serine/threonine PP2A family protein phosphatase
MLFAIIGDVHGNVDALWATLDVLDRLEVEDIICAGDLVGYGGAPSECIDLIRGRGIRCVKGNHDAYVVRPESMSAAVREDAANVISWTRSALSVEQLEWLDALPVFLECMDFQVTHASNQPYPEWHYILSPRRAAMHFLFQKKPLSFTAHSHVPLLGMHQPGHHLSLELFRNLILPDNVSVMVGVGAVGQPRDQDPRACAMLYDTVKRSVSILRVKYDVPAAQKRIREAGLPESLAIRLEWGQ